MQLTKMNKNEQAYKTYKECLSLKELIPYTEKKNHKIIKDFMDFLEVLK